MFEQVVEGVDRQSFWLCLFVEWRSSIECVASWDRCNLRDLLIVGWSQPNTACTTRTIAASHRALTPRPYVRDVEGATWQGLCVDRVLGLLRTYSHFVLVMSVV